MHTNRIQKLRHLMECGEDCDGNCESCTKCDGNCGEDCKKGKTVAKSSTVKTEAVDNKVTKPTPQMKKIIAACYPDWKGRKIYTVVASTYHPADFWDEGSRDYSMLWDMKNGRAGHLPGVSTNPFHQEAHKDFTIPEGTLVVEHGIFMGKNPGTIRIYGSATDLAQIMPPKTEDKDKSMQVQEAKPSKTPVIRITFSKVIPGASDEDEPEEEHGWVDEDGVSMEPDDTDKEDELTCVDLAVKFLEKAGVAEASSTSFHTGIWYSGSPETNHRTGEETTQSYHLAGFTPEQEREVYKQLKHQLEGKEQTFQRMVEGVETVRRLLEADSAKSSQRSRKSLTFGVLPRENEVMVHAAETIDPDTDKPFLSKGEKFSYHLKGEEGDLISELGYNPRGKVALDEIYAMIKDLVEFGNLEDDAAYEQHGDLIAHQDDAESWRDTASSLASSFMWQLGYDWI
jgi:hypothetical protein